MLLKTLLQFGTVLDDLCADRQTPVAEFRGRDAALSAQAADWFEAQGYAVAWCSETVFWVYE